MACRTADRVVRGRPLHSDTSYVSHGNIPISTGSGCVLSSVYSLAPSPEADMHAQAGI